MTTQSEALEQIKETYRTELRSKALAISASIASNDSSQLEHLVHKLAGSSGTYGYTALSAHLRALEDDLTGAKRSLNIETWQKRFNELIDEATS